VTSDLNFQITSDSDAQSGQSLRYNIVPLIISLSPVTYEGYGYEFGTAPVVIRRCRKIRLALRVYGRDN
jgi:hypothetical protein